MMAGCRVGRFGCFGKLGASREFIIEGSQDLASTRFDRWIGEGLGSAKVRLGSRFDHLFSMFPEYEFLWTAAGWERVLAGRLVPSADGAGRRHPFCVFVVLDCGRSVAAPHLILASLRTIFAEVASVTAAARSATTTAAVLASVRAASAAPDESGAASAYGRFADITTAPAFWQETFADRHGERAGGALRALHEAASPLRRDGREITFGIRVPLPREAARVEPLLAAAFWYDLFAQHAGRAASRATLFWTAGRGDFAPALFLLPPEPSPSHWTCLVDRNASSDTMSALDDERGLEQPEGSVPSALREALDSPAATLRTYLTWAGGGPSR